MIERYELGIVVRIKRIGKMHVCLAHMSEKEKFVFA